MPFERLDFEVLHLNPEYYPETVNPRENEFGLCVRPIEAYFLHLLLGKLDTGKAWAIGVRLTHAKKHRAAPTKDKSDLPGWASGTWLFDFERFWKASPAQRNELAAKRLRDSLLEIAKSRGWALDPIRNAYKQIHKTRFVFEQASSEPAPSPSGRWTARWQSLFLATKFELTVVVENADTGKTFTFALSWPPYAHTVQWLGRLEWASDQQLLLVDRAGKQQQAIRLEELKNGGMRKVGKPVQGPYRAPKKPTRSEPRPRRVAPLAKLKRSRHDLWFWSLVKKLDWKKTGDDDAVVAPVVKALAALPVRDIFRFDDVLAQKLFALDGEAYAREIGEGYDDDHLSPDAFLYARCCTVANGKSHYAKVLATPKATLKDHEFEAILYIAQKAYEQKMGKAYPHVPKPSYETYSNARGWK